MVMSLNANFFMTIPFLKYQGAGNDFIMIDQRQTSYSSVLDQQHIAQLCDRRFGIGADGLIILDNDANTDFRMIYYNSDGNQSSMCGNGGRCIAAFAREIGCIKGDSTQFSAIDGKHEAVLLENEMVDLKMSDVDNISLVQNQVYCLNTGSPHYVAFVDVLPEDVKGQGSNVRYSDPYKKEGINVNFVEKSAGSLVIATYERGVEDETLACGTGVTAAAIAAFVDAKNGDHTIDVFAKGGKLSVRFHKQSDNIFTDIWLKGEAKKVFSGAIII